MHGLIALLPTDPGGGGPVTTDGVYGGIKCLVNGVVTIGCIPGLFTLVLNAVFAFAGIGAVIMLVYSGIQMIIANGDAKMLETAGKAFTHALIGLIVILLSFLLINFIAAVTGVHCITGFNFGCSN